MSRKNFIITTSILFILVVGGLIGGYFYLTNTKSSESDKTSGSGSLAPSGQLQDLSGGIVGTTTEPGKMPRFRQISETPVAGYDFVDKGSGYVIWYVDRGNGNILETSTSSINVSRITNTTIPKVYEAYIGKGGANIILRVLNEELGTIQTFIASPKTKAGTSSDPIKDLIGYFGPENISFLSISPSKDSFFGIVSGATGAEGVLYPFGGKSSTIFSNPAYRWIPQWVNSSAILMTTAPSAKTQNLAYLFNPQTKTTTKILGPRNGLVVSSSPDTSYLLFSENKGNTLMFSILNTKTAEETTLSNKTIADKCVWSKEKTTIAYCGFPKTIPNGLYPDAWYQGKVVFDDSVGMVNSVTGAVNNIFDPKDFAVQVDVMNPTISKDGKYLLFTNKSDLTLWMLEL